MKKLTAVFLCVLLVLGCVFSLSVSAEGDDPTGVPSGMTMKQALYVHAVTDSDDTQAWQAWQSVHDEDFYEDNTREKYFFLPSSADDDTADVYNGFSASVTLNGVAIPSGEVRTVSYAINTNYNVTAGGSTYTLRYMRSSAEAAVYINTPDADGNGTDLMTYLNSDKSLSAKATGAIVSPEGKIDNTTIKKIKGRGNTSWGKPKKGYNITYDKKVSVGGMEKNKKYSILPNYQDDSLARNRILYDLSDAVGMPYASDSRFVDFYVNGYYWGTYQMAEKVEEGSLVTDVKGDEYLNADGTIKEDFPFIAEVDASAGDDDYYVTCNGNTKITIKAPEIDPGQPGYEEVKTYVQTKYNELINTCRTASRRSSTSIAGVMDLDSAAKLYLINELGKNWDAGVSSCFLTYKQDEEGNYKFFGSPVWDYDNSLGNAVGVAYELNNIGVTDYTQYSGWWCRYKGKASNETVSYNIINNFARIKEVQNVAATVWFEDFLPAINHFSGKTTNAGAEPEFYSSGEYFAKLVDSAEMNYRSGWLLNTGSWIANHTTLKTADYNFYTGTYTAKTTAARYSQSSFTDMFNYARDWMISRAAWLSNEMYADYTGSKVKFDVDRDGAFTISDATAVQLYLAEYTELNIQQYELADVNHDGKVTISDVTEIQRFLAEFIDLADDDGFVRTETSGGNNTTQEPGEVTATFVNTLSWEGTIYIYYYGNNTYPLEWPGTEMTPAGKIDGYDAYTIVVPDFVEVVIFDNGIGASQTANIPFDGSSHVYRALESTNPLNGRHDYTID